MLNLKKNWIHATTAFAMSVSLINPAFAGFDELSAMLRSPAGRVILRELSVADGMTISQGVSGAEADRAEEILDRLREDYLRQRPRDESLFDAASKGSLDSEQLDTLRDLLKQSDTSALRSLTFVPESWGAGSFAAAGRGFVNGSAAPAAAVTPSNRGIRFRAFVRDFVKASNHSQPAARAKAVRQVLAANIDFAQYVLEGRDLAPLLKEADLEFSGSSTAGLVNVDQFFTASLRGQLNNVMSNIPSQDLGTMARKFGIPLIDMFGGLFGGSMAAKPSALAVIKGAKLLSVEARVTLLESLGDEPFIELTKSMDQAIQSANVSESPAVQQILDPNAGIDLSYLPKSKAKLFGDLLTRYFNQLPIAAKRKILGAVLELAPHSPVEKQIAAVLQNSGPAAQKLFQLVGRDAKSPLIRAVMAELLTNCTTFDGRIAAKMIEQELGRPLSEMFSEIDLDHPVAASVGQIHFARLRSTGERVVVKVLKPGVKEAALAEIETFEKIVGDNDFERDMVRNVKEALLSELDLRIEYQNNREGSAYISEYRHIFVAEAVPGFPVTERVMVQQRAKGVPMAKLQAPMDMVSPDKIGRMSKAQKAALLEELTTRGDALERLLSRWFERAVFEDGFFHADPHPGNLFYEAPTTPKGEASITLIDFGSADRLTMEQRRGFVNFSLAVAAKSPDYVIDALGDFGKIPDEALEGLKTQLQAIFAKKLGLVDRVREVLLLAVGSEMRMPRQLMQFTRGDLFIEKELNYINSALDVLDPKGKAGRYIPLSTYVKVSMRRGAMEMPAKATRLLPDWIKGPIFDFFGQDTSSRVTSEVITEETIEKLFAASRDRILGFFGRGKQ